MGMKVNGTSGLTFPDTTTLASAGQASVRAWVNFNGTGTVAIRASFNVASITDNGTGDYTVNFTTAMPDVNYSATATAGSNNTNSDVMYEADFSVRTTSSIRYSVFAIGVGLFDSNSVNVAIFR
jgi:hypothetical protein